MKTKPRTNKKIMESVWFDQEDGFIFCDGVDDAFIGGFQCSFSYNVLYGKLGTIVKDVKEFLKPENENEIIVFLSYNSGTIAGKYVIEKPQHLSENSKCLFYKIEDRFNEFIIDLNCGFTVRF